MRRHTQLAVHDRRTQVRLAARSEQVEPRPVRRLEACYTASPEAPVSLTERPIEPNAERTIRRGRRDQIPFQRGRGRCTGADVAAGRHVRRSAGGACRAAEHRGDQGKQHHGPSKKSTRGSMSDKQLAANRLAVHDYRRAPYMRTPDSVRPRAARTLIREFRLAGHARGEIISRPAATVNLRYRCYL